MKQFLSSVFGVGFLLWGAQIVRAAPVITEIRLGDAPGYGPSPSPVNGFVFRANGDFYWLEGTTENVVRHHYSIGTQEFARLAAVYERSRFWRLQKLYDRPPGATSYLADGPTVTLQVVRGGQTKIVQNYDDNGPSDLWELEMITRGFASRFIGLKRTPRAKLRPKPSRTPIPVIRGTKPGQ